MRVAVIGAGIAGLAVAVRLRCAGHEVVVFESNAYTGGKLTEIRSEGYRFDAGPSLFTMPQLLEQVFEVAGRNVSDYLVYARLPVVCRYFWADGTVFTAYDDAEQRDAEVARVFGTKYVAMLRKALARSRQKYEATGRIFLYKPLHSWRTWWSTDVLRAIPQIPDLDIFTTMHRANRRLVQGHPKLTQLLDRYATYNGSDPYRAPGILNTIPYLEHGFGAYLPQGGMHSISQSVYRLAVDVGVVFRLNTQVEEITTARHHVTGVRLADGTVLPFERVVSNMDIVPTYRKLLPLVRPPRRVLNQERSSSAIIFYWGVRRSFPELDVHNILFGADYQDEFEALFGRGTVCDDPTVYINITSKLLPTDAPEGCENWFVMVNAPASDGSQRWDELLTQVRARVLHKVAQVLGVDLAPLIATERVLDPRGIELRTSSYRGALYGTSSNSRVAAFLRHTNRNSGVKGLFHCGGSVHPGGGIPLCLSSGHIVAQVFR